MFLDYAGEDDKVSLSRNTLNPHDINAIKVLNEESQQVGHIQREDTFYLSLALQKFRIRYDAIVLEDDDGYKMPASIRVFSTEDTESLVDIVSFLNESFLTQFHVV